MKVEPGLAIQTPHVLKLSDRRASHDLDRLSLSLTAGSVCSSPGRTQYGHQDRPALCEKCDATCDLDQDLLTQNRRTRDGADCVDPRAPTLLRQLAPELVPAQAFSQIWTCCGESWIRATVAIRIRQRRGHFARAGTISAVTPQPMVRRLDGGVDIATMRLAVLQVALEIRDQIQAVASAIARPLAKGVTRTRQADILSS